MDLAESISREARKRYGDALKGRYARSIAISEIRARPPHLRGIALVAIMQLMDEPEAHTLAGDMLCEIGVGLMQCRSWSAVCPRDHTPRMMRSEVATRAYAALPEFVPIYRGALENLFERGSFWALDRNYALRYPHLYAHSAARHRDTRRVVLSATVPKQAIVALFPMGGPPDSVLPPDLQRPLLEVLLHPDTAASLQCAREMVGRGPVFRGEDRAEPLL